VSARSAGTKFRSIPRCNVARTDIRVSGAVPAVCQRAPRTSPGKIASHSFGSAPCASDALWPDHGARNRVRGARGSEGGARSAEWWYPGSPTFEEDRLTACRTRPGNGAAPAARRISGGVGASAPGLEHPHGGYELIYTSAGAVREPRRYSSGEAGRGGGPWQRVHPSRVGG